MTAARLLSAEVARCEGALPSPPKEGLPPRGRGATRSAENTRRVTVRLRGAPCGNMHGHPMQKEEPVPLFMDVHNLEGGSVSLKDVAAGHMKDLETQAAHDVN